MAGMLYNYIVRRVEENLRTYRRLLCQQQSNCLGGKEPSFGFSGGLTPIALDLHVDIKNILLDFVWIVMIVYILKVIGLLYAGGISAFVDKKETSYKKLFMLGLAAPALISSVINGQALSSQLDQKKESLKSAIEIFSLCTNN